MKQFYLFTFLLYGVSSNSQVFNVGTGVQVTSLSNSGVAAGVTNQISHFLWTKDNGMKIIGTVTNENPLAYSTKISADGKFISGSMSNPESGMDEMALYNVEAGTWKYLGGLSGSSGNVKSSAWNISADGKAVVGYGYAADNTAQAIIWTEENGVVDLGTSITGRTSRANAVSSDKMTIVGRQDIDDGSLTGAYWENGTEHSVTVNGENVEMIEDVSADGKTMITGGFPNSVIWNKDSGATAIVVPNDVGVLPKSTAKGISADGKTVVGYYYSFLTGSYTGKGYIWTKEKGVIRLNDYVTSLGFDNQGISFILPLCISPDGKYIGGIGHHTADNKLVGFVIKLPSTDLAIDIDSLKQISVFPNPVKDILNIQNSIKAENIDIYNITGQKVKTIKASTTKVDISSLSKGTYILHINNGIKSQNIKFIKD